MPTETRYKRQDSHTVNGLTARQLQTTNTTTYSSISADYTYIGVRVAKRDAAGNETTISPAGQSVAVAETPGPSGVVSATWDCPQTTLARKDAIVVRVYAGDTTNPDTLLETFITDQLGAQSLDADTWTVYYAFYRTGAPLFLLYYRFGSSTYPSRIEDFTYTPAPPVVAQPVGDGITFAI